MAKSAVPKEDREIRTADKELKAIHAIQRALTGLDAQAASRVMMFCLDRARDNYEKSNRDIDAPERLAARRAAQTTGTGAGAAIGSALGNVVKQDLPAPADVAARNATASTPATVGV